MSSEIYLQVIDTKKDNDNNNVSNILEFKPKQNGHEYNQLYVHLFNLRAKYLDDYSDGVANWYPEIKDYIMQRNTYIMFTTNNLTVEYNKLKTIKEAIDIIINRIKANNNNNPSVDKAELTNTKDTLERLYIDGVESIFTKYDKITKCFVRYMCKKNDKVLLIRKHKI